MGDDWYRSPAWERADQADFEQHLARSRPASRAQFLRIKALALLDAGSTTTAYDLLLRILADDAAPKNEAAFAHEKLGDIERASGALNRAADRYRLALATAAPTGSGTSGEVSLSLGEVLFDLDAVANAGEVSALLDASRERITFNSTAFRWNTLRARLAESVGDIKTQRTMALAALDLADAPPQFARKPTVGVVNATSETVELLRRLSST